MNWGRGIFKNPPSPIQNTLSPICRWLKSHFFHILITKCPYFSSNL
ncbi:hypothetical protein CLOHYLEM_06313 [[Clostridium] hylemonae DSM 15053]|uniref:Uncharacterized protein n=1 Tax=[Clostridium] hylemonae DSM 15053 TaxID=553973 RepID=C0C2K7_9FIRM|nr:hypothetical protein CLOHYLEM_06313 [[Clostridium] hylemonae DSM 15053]